MSVSVPVCRCAGERDLVSLRYDQQLWGAAPSTQEEHGAAFVCAQQQLALLYAQRFNVLYTHALNSIMPAAVSVK